MAKATIREVAKQAGVSIATVSRVINGAENVRPETVRRVMDAIAAADYIPNATAQTLKTSATKLVGFLISDISNSHFTTMAKVIEHELRDEGYSLIVCSTDDLGGVEMEYLHRLLALQVDGLILNATGLNQQYIAELSRKLPMVLVDRDIALPEFQGDFVGSNNSAGIQNLTRYLIDNGHRRIGIIASNLFVSTGQERLKGFASAMGAIHIDVSGGYEYRYDSKYSDEQSGYDGCRFLMEKKEPPTAIVVANNAMSLGVYKYLADHEIAVPGQVSVVSYGNIENSELFYVRPTYTTLNPRFIGEKAALHLLTRMRGEQTGKREIIFEPSLVINGSVRRL